MKYEVEKLSKVYKASSDLAVNECIVPLKGSSSFKQFMKPTKRSYKLWCLVDARTGYILNSDLYIGKNKGENVYSSVLSTEAKSQGKSKEKYNKKYKTEGSPKEAKYRYTKNSPKYEKRKNEKVQEENLEQENVEAESQENEAPQGKEESIQKPKKQKRPYTISVELLEEEIAEENHKSKGNVKKGSKVGAEESADLPTKGHKDSKQKVPKEKYNRGPSKGKSPSKLQEDTGPSDFIVHVPKNKKGMRQVLVFQVPMQEEEESFEETESGNAIQHYISEGQEVMNEEDCSCEESTVEDEPLQGEDTSNNMCYYNNKNK